MWQELAPGANETLSLVLRPRIGGRLKTARARVTYSAAAAPAAADDEGTPAAAAPPVSSSSTTPGLVDIVSVAAYERATAPVALAHGAAMWAAAALFAAPALKWFSHRG